VFVVTAPMASRGMVRATSWDLLFLIGALKDAAVRSHPDHGPVRNRALVARREHGPGATWMRASTQRVVEVFEHVATRLENEGIRSSSRMTSWCDISRQSGRSMPARRAGNGNRTANEDAEIGSAASCRYLFNLTDVVKNLRQYILDRLRF
jgi:hypothetical protein